MYVWPCVTVGVSFVAIEHGRPMLNIVMEYVDNGTLQNQVEEAKARNAFFPEQLVWVTKRTASNIPCVGFVTSCDGVASIVDVFDICMYTCMLVCVWVCLCVRQILSWIAQIILAVQYLHSKNILHRLETIVYAIRV